MYFTRALLEGTEIGVSLSCDIFCGVIFFQPYIIMLECMLAYVHEVFQNLCLLLH